MILRIFLKFQLQQQQQHHIQLQQQQQWSGALLNTFYKFNMSEVRPEEISYTVTDTTLKIHALREEMDGGFSKNDSEFYYRKLNKVSRRKA